jgi:hypothetical protein
LGTVLTLDEILATDEVAQWLDINQYAMHLSISQEEEMTVIGVLLYGSLFLYQPDLLKNILLHPLWVALNENRESKIIIDLVIKPFRGSSKSVDMIFFRAEQSKKDDA